MDKTDSIWRTATATCGMTTVLTKRELFAAMAMQGMMASTDTADSSAGGIAKWSCVYADALLAALEGDK